MIIRESVTSSNVVSIGHDAELGLMEVQFKPSLGGVSKVYVYEHVSEDEFACIKTAESVGRALAAIKGHHPAYVVATVDAAGIETRLSFL